MNTFKCARCGASNDITLYARKCAHPCPLRCRRCATVHSYWGGHVEVISPHMMPISTPGRVSPWMDSCTRPPCVGMFEVKVRDSVALEVFWDGARYKLPGGRYVLSNEVVQAWRGSWGYSND